MNTPTMLSELSDQQYRLGSSALLGATKYLTGELGGAQIDQTSKYQGMATDVLEQAATNKGSGDTSFLGQTQDIGAQSAARAMGLSSVTNTKINAGLDEINKIRSTLGSQGIKTAGLAVGAAGQSVAAYGLLPKENPLVSGLAGLAGAASAGYGAYQNQQATKAGGPNYQQNAPVASSAYGGDSAFLQGGGGAGTVNNMSMSNALFGPG